MIESISYSKMLYRARLDSPGNGKGCSLKQKRSGLGRLDSGIDLDLSLGSSSNGVIRAEDFLVVQAGDLFKPSEVPDEKKLIYVEKVNSIPSVEEGNDSDTDGIFNMDMNFNKQDAVKGYIPAVFVEVDAKLETDNSKTRCLSCGCSDDDQPTTSDVDLVKKLEEENRNLKAQIQELKIANNGLLDSLSWNGEDDLGLCSLKVLESPCTPRSPRSPRYLRSPRSMRSRTITSDCSDTETEALFKVFEVPIEKKEDVIEEDITLSCTLCSRKIKITELEIHSKVCSSAPSSVTSSPMAADVLLINVTQVTFNSCTDQLLKVITKTTLEKFQGHIFEVNRRIADFLWFREMLQRCCPSRIVPCLKLHGNVNGNFREVQRFLRRLTSHKVLKSHSFVKEFLSVKDLEPLKKQYESRYPNPLCLSLRYENVSIDQDSLLNKAMQYISSLLERLGDLTEHLKQNFEMENISDGISEKFKLLSEAEMNETYLKIAASGLSRITQEATASDEESYEAALVEELESVIGNIEEAEQLLKRVEMKMIKFLYWKEQMKLYEKQNANNQEELGSKATCTKKWAEASANFVQAKSSLENMCKNVSEELKNFDLMKEQDIKEVLIDFADGKFQHYEKLQSKWYGVRIMLDANILPNNRAFTMS